MTDAAKTARILVLAGTNGAGKSSIGGEWLRQNGGEYFNPDEATRRILEEHPEMPVADANSRAWHEGKRLLEEAIREEKNYAFETTLGGNTITGLLRHAAPEGLELHIWYVGLDSVETHLERVKLRVEGGGHDIPEEKIRSRFDGSRRNLAELIPHVANLVVYDNSLDADPTKGTAPELRLLLRVERGLIVKPTVEELEKTPAWAKPIAAAAIARHLQKRREP